MKIGKNLPCGIGAVIKAIVDTAPWTLSYHSSFVLIRAYKANLNCIQAIFLALFVEGLWGTFL